MYTGGVDEQSLDIRGIRYMMKSVNSKGLKPNKKKPAASAGRSVQPTKAPSQRSYSMSANLNSDAWTLNAKWGRRGRRESSVAQWVTQREVVKDIYGSLTFTTNELNIQPGKDSVFPWAAGIALKYQKYDIHELVMEFRPTVSGFAPDGQTGRVTLSCDYDASNPAPTAMNQAMDMQPSVSGMPSQVLTLALDPEQLNSTGKYIRGNQIPGGTDPKTYDGGNMYVSVDGTQGSGKIGELVLRYKIALFNPLLQIATTLPRNFVRSAAQRTTDLAFGASGATVDYSGLTLASTNPLGLTTDGTWITFPPGFYNIVISFWVTVPTNGMQSFALWTLGSNSIASSEQFSLVQAASDVFTLRSQVTIYFTATSAVPSMKIQFSSLYPGTIPTFKSLLASVFAL